MAVLIGIDYGNKKLGFATGQNITKTATPLVIIKNNEQLWQEIELIFKAWKPEKIIIGKPELQDGTKHPLEKNIENFIKKLSNIYLIPIFRENEAYTSEQAKERSRESNKKPNPNKEIDDYAAAIILERWMDSN